MADKPLDGLLIILESHSLPAVSVQALRDDGALIIKRPGTDLQVKRLATGDPLEVPLNLS